VSIPINKYFIVTPSSQFISKAYATLNGTDLFFFVNETANLRVVNMQSGTLTATPGSTIFTLVQAAKWVDVIEAPGVVYVYYADPEGNVWYIPYRNFGGLVPSPVMLSTVQAVTFSTIFTPQTNPPAFMMMIDDGVHHQLYTATDPLFSALLAPVQTTYNNSLDLSDYITMPSIAMHPTDTTVLTVICQQVTVPPTQTSVGFYAVTVEGLS
jgi:hypothetical protein